MSDDEIERLLNDESNYTGPRARSPTARLTSEAKMRQMWEQLSRGRDVQQINTARGTVYEVDLGNGDFVQYRTFSNTGGPTLDIDRPGSNVERIHVG